jgi:putative alpha-1,2-mannosidase
MITAPLVDRVTIDLDDRFFPGRSFTITARGNVPGAVKYIGASTLDGQPLADLTLTHDQIVKGGDLVLDLID